MQLSIFSYSTRKNVVYKKYGLGLVQLSAAFWLLPHQEVETTRNLCLQLETFTITPYIQTIKSMNFSLWIRIIIKVNISRQWHEWLCGRAGIQHHRMCFVIIISISGQSINELLPSIIIIYTYIMPCQHFWTLFIHLKIIVMKRTKWSMVAFALELLTWNI